MQVIDYLLNIFNMKGYVTGRQLPTEFEIMAEVGVSRNTVRKAILEMEQKGIVERRHGSGTFYSGVDVKKVSGGLIGLVNFSGMGYIFPEIVKGLEDTLYVEGYSPVLAGSCDDIEREITSLKMLMEQDVKGLIVDLSKYYTLGAQIPVMELVQSFKIPVVVTHWNGTLNNFSSIYISDEKIGYNATNYLIKKGHKKIGMIYKKNTQAGQYRLNGYIKAMEEAGISYNEKYISSYDDFDDSHDVDHAFSCTKELLERCAGDITAIFYYTDKCAMEGYRAVGNSGLKIPEDISVISFDNYKSSMFVTPPLTTFEHPKYSMGRWAAKLLIDEINEEVLHQAKHIVFEPVLIERGSVKDINKKK